MLIGEIMNRQVISIESTDTIKLAMLKIAQHRIRHLPIIDNEILVGIVSDRDLRDACPSVLRSTPEDFEVLNKPVSQIMYRDVVTIHPMDFVEEAALLLYENKIGCLPVIENEKVVGIVTETDILYTLITSTGVLHPSYHIEVEVEDRVGALADITNLLRNSHANLLSVLVFPGKEAKRKNLVFRIQTPDPQKITEDLAASGYSVIWPIN